jgi:putative Holliday junction resolvase
VLGIDAGERRIGLALSDETGLLASPAGIVSRHHGLRPALDEIAALADREGVACVVVGLPLNADGSEGRQARRARELARLVGQVLNRPVELWDERLSSQEAEAILRAQGRDPRRVRAQGGIDAVAAAVILQSYLDARRVS